MSRFESGQVWVCSARGGMPPLMCFIGKQEDLLPEAQTETIVSVFVVPHPKAKTAGWPEIGHLPMHLHALQKSDLRLIKEGQSLPDHFDDGYAQWRLAFDDGRAAAWPIPLSEAYHAVLSAADKKP